MSYSQLKCFKAYDIRGRMPEQLNPEISYLIGCAYAEFIKPTQIAVGYDIRPTSSSLADSLTQGLIDSGVDVINIGVCGTEEVYFTTFNRQLDGGIMVTASHNPIDYNGMKMVGKDARPISSDTGLKQISQLIEQKITPADTANKGSITYQANKQAFADYLLQFSDFTNLKKLKIVVNPGNSSAGLVIDLLERHLPFELIKICYEPDGTFPYGIPNPLLPENRQLTADTVRKNNADLGIAFDGDFDRCFFFDETGEFIEGYYLVGLLAHTLLTNNKNGKVIYDPRLTWNTQDMVAQAGGTSLQSKAGHAFIKDAMRKNDAIYGGEMSAHHYFKDFAYCDSGMLPWLLLTKYLSDNNISLKQAVAQAIAKYPCSGEINFTVENSQQLLAGIQQHYRPQNPKIDLTDGISAEFADWRFNLRASNTEPLIRLNIETRKDKTLLEQKIQELTNLIQN